MDGKSEPRYAALLRSGRWFGGISRELQRELLALAIPRTLAPGERLFSRGDPPCGLYAAVDGSIRVTGATESGKEVVLALIEPPSWFGEISVFDRSARTHDTVAQTEATVLRVPQEALEAMLDREPRHWRDLGVLLASKLRLTFMALEDSAALPVSARLARRLVLTAGALGEWSDRSRRVVGVRQDQLAAMLGTSRQTMNTLLKDFEAQGLLRVSYGQVEILDLAGLRRAAGLEPG